jgi:hypothetical protein
VLFFLVLSHLHDLRRSTAVTTAILPPAKILCILVSKKSKLAKKINGRKVDAALSPIQ